MAKSRQVTAVDLFCGAGGSSKGAKRACERLDLRLDLTAINHWDIAVETHAKNMPDVRHICETLDSVDPRKIFKGRSLDVLWASPECQGHSDAAGGKARSDQSRATAWHVLRWAEALRPTEIICENVRGFLRWGPLDRHGRPMKRRAGEIFQAWVQALRAIGYTVEWRLLNSADYGAATSRLRLFVRARLGRQTIDWPVITHSRGGEGGLLPWRGAREIIDWNLLGQSIFHRKNPLAMSTIRRIYEGFVKLSGPEAEPYLVVLRNHMAGKPLHEPLPTIAASGNHIGLAQPFIRQPTHGGRNYSIDRPLPTVTGARRGELGVIQPVVIPQFSGQIARSVDQPINTITTTSRGIGLAQAFLTPYYANGKGDSIDHPLRTVTGKARHALVQPTVDLDILYRMLQSHELAAAMGFPEGYEFVGNKEQVVRQIGNAVEVHNADALYWSALAA
jgi:DNA (cytosine-5)-methyltransferase 1